MFKKLTFPLLLPLLPHLAAHGVSRLLSAAAVDGAGGPRRPQVTPRQLAVVRVAGVRLLGYACSNENTLSMVYKGWSIRDD